jgi:hypothetical protein
MMFPRRPNLCFFRAVMLVTIGGSLLGINEHLEGNIAFELEIRPNATSAKS